MCVADTIIRHSETIQSNVLSLRNSVLELWLPINITFRPCIYCWKGCKQLFGICLSYIIRILSFWMKQGLLPLYILTSLQRFELEDGFEVDASCHLFSDLSDFFTTVFTCLMLAFFSILYALGG